MMVENICIGCGAPFDVDRDDAWHTLCPDCADQRCDLCGQELRFGCPDCAVPTTAPTHRPGLLRRARPAARAEPEIRAAIAVIARVGADVEPDMLTVEEGRRPATLAGLLQSS